MRDGGGVQISEKRGGRRLNFRFTMDSANFGLLGDECVGDVQKRQLILSTMLFGRIV